MPIAARYADVWHSYGPPEMMREKSARLSRMALEGGRDPVEITRRVVAVARGGRRHDRPARGPVGGRGVRLPRVRLAGRWPRPDRGVRLAVPLAIAPVGRAAAGGRASGRVQRSERSWRSASSAAAFAAAHRIATELHQAGDPAGVAQQERDRGARVRRAVGVRQVEHRSVGMVRREVTDHPHRTPGHPARGAHGGHRRRLHVERGARRRRRARPPVRDRRGTRRSSTRRRRPRRSTAWRRSGSHCCGRSRRRAAGRRRPAVSPIPPAIPTTSTWSISKLSSRSAVALRASVSPIPVRVATTSTVPTRPVCTEGPSARVSRHRLHHGCELARHRCEHADPSHGSVHARSLADPRRSCPSGGDV